MASGTATTAPSTAITAPSTAPTAPAMPLTAGPSTIEPIVPIVAPLGAQGTPIVIQRARPVVSTEQQTMQSTAVYGTPAVRAMPAMSARFSYPMGYYGQGNQFPLMPNPNWMSEREQMLQHELLQEGSSLKLGEPSQAPISSSGLLIKVEDDVEIISVRSASAKRP